MMHPQGLYPEVRCQTNVQDSINVPINDSLSQSIEGVERRTRLQFPCSIWIPVFFYALFA